MAYYQGQVRELCTNYGEIGGIWFDGWWDRPDADWDLAGTYRLIHELQPGALVGNNHHVAPMPGEDFQMFEQDLPGENAAGFNKAGIAADLPLETCLTINDSWGYNAADTHYKSAEQIIRALVAPRGGGQPAVECRPAARRHDRPGGRQRLVEVGKWLATYGDSIYGTRRGPIAPSPGASRPPRARRTARARSTCTSSSPSRVALILSEATASLYAVSVRQRSAVAADAGGRRDGPEPAQRRPKADRHDRRAAAPGPRPMSATRPGRRR